MKLGRNAFSFFFPAPVRTVASGICFSRWTAWIDAIIKYLQNRNKTLRCRKMFVSDGSDGNWLGNGRKNERRVSTYRGSPEGNLSEIATSLVQNFLEKLFRHIWEQSFSEVSLNLYLCLGYHSTGMNDICLKFRIRKTFDARSWSSFEKTLWTVAFQSINCTSPFERLQSRTSMLQFS